MNLFLCYSIAILNRNYPYRVNSIIKSQIDTRPLEETDINWEKFYNYKYITKKYFNENIEKENSYCEIFKIYGYPAALLEIQYNNNKLMVTNFILNKNLLLMFDAGDILRISFYKRFKNINIKNAKNKQEFIMI